MSFRDKYSSKRRNKHNTTLSNPLLVQPEGSTLLTPKPQNQRQQEQSPDTASSCRYNDEAVRTVDKGWSSTLGLSAQD